MGAHVAPNDVTLARDLGFAKAKRGTSIRGPGHLPNAWVTIHLGYSQATSNSATSVEVSGKLQRGLPEP